MGDDSIDVSGMQPDTSFAPVQAPSVPQMPNVASGLTNAQQKALLGKLLMSQGSQSGGMAPAGANGNSQFYVAPSPLSGINSALSKGLGAYMTTNNQGN